MVRFLRDRYDYEEALIGWAEGASPEWYAASADDEPRNSQRAQVISGKDARITGDTDASYADHISYYDPSRMRLELDARRRAVDACEKFLHESEDGPDSCAASVLAALALPYSGHGDYRKEWRP